MSQTMTELKDQKTEEITSRVKQSKGEKQKSYRKLVKPIFKGYKELKNQEEIGIRTIAILRFLTIHLFLEQKTGLAKNLLHKCVYNCLISNLLSEYKIPCLFQSEACCGEETVKIHVQAGSQAVLQLIHFIHTGYVYSTTKFPSQDLAQLCQSIGVDGLSHVWSQIPFFCILFPGKIP